MGRRRGVEFWVWLERKDGCEYMGGKGICVTVILTVGQVVGRRV